jgi:uncharacterized protein YidB (DUF937 family)
MGLLDVINGMQNSRAGQRAPSSTTSSGGMSPMTMALLGLIAQRALKSFGGAQPNPIPAGGKPNVGPDGTVVAGMPGVGSGGGLGDLLKGRLGGLLAGGAAGGVLSGGLGDLLKQFQQTGHGEVASSWVGSGQNKAIAPKDLSEALGADQINGLMAQTGLSRDELLAGLSEQLPRVVDHLTPDGRLPTEQEMSRLV